MKKLKKLEFIEKNASNNSNISFLPKYLLSQSDLNSIQGGYGSGCPDNSCNTNTSGCTLSNTGSCNSNYGNCGFGNDSACNTNSAYCYTANATDCNTNYQSCHGGNIGNCNANYSSQV